MAEQEHHVDSRFAYIVESSTALDDSEVVQRSVIHARAVEEAGAAIARQLNGPLTALLLYVGEIKQQSHQFSGNRDYLQQVVENALLQTERVCAVVKQFAGTQAPAVEGVGPGRLKRNGRAPSVILSSEAGQKPLTRREREVLQLISEGCSNKQGALRMRISPRTFESHRAEAMRKLGARNTADLVRAALLHSRD
jgi:DNA-binding CsgD family transcriptional regulator